MNIVIFTTDKNRFIHILQQIENEKEIKINEIVLLSTSELENKEISYKNSVIRIKNINTYKEYKNINVAIFIVSKELSSNYIYNFIENDCIVFDNSDYYIDDTNIPTILYNINNDRLKDYQNKNIIKLPSSSTIQLLTTINPLYNLSEIKRIVVSTYQSTSTISKKAIDELFMHTKKLYENIFLEAVNFKKQITFNVLPQIGDVTDDKYYLEEKRIINESQEILNNGIAITATCAMVPTFVGNCQSINIEFKNSFDIKDVYNVFQKNSDCISLLDRFEDYRYATPKEVVTEENVFISRIRKDESVKNALNLWSVADNLKLEAVNIVNLLKYFLISL